MKYQNLKTELKQLSENIRKKRSTLKAGQRGEIVPETPVWRLQNEIPSLASEIRHKHIAYCLLRGRSYEQIESKVKDGNEPNWKTIEKIKELHTPKVDEDVEIQIK